MKVYYLYKVGSKQSEFAMRFVAELSFDHEPDTKELRRAVAKKHPELKTWEALRKKYVADKSTGRLGLPKKKGR